MHVICATSNYQDFTQARQAAIEADVFIKFERLPAKKGVRRRALYKVFTSKPIEVNYKNYPQYPDYG